MPGFELLGLVVGAVALAAALVVVLSLRPRPGRAAAPVSSGLIEPDRSLAAPPGMTPGMVGALRDGDVDARDLRITLVDLAARGYLRVTALEDEDGTSYDWVIRRTTREPAGLHPFEHVLLTLPFESRNPDEPARSSTTLGAISSGGSGPFQRADTALTEQLRARGWIGDDSQPPHSPWGWVGALMLVAGLLVTVAMMFGWLATGDFRGVLGGLMLVAAGILLASQGRRTGPQSDTGSQARTSANDFRDAIANLKAEDLSPEQTPMTFNRLLPWALAFGNHEVLARTVDDELRRASNWGRPADLDLSWFQSGHPEQAPTAREFSQVVSRLVSSRTVGRGGWPRITGRQGRSAR